jgi:hypothetical protein
MLFRQGTAMNTKKHAIRMALFRLGMQARPKEVVQALAHQGIFVSPDLVRLVKIEMTEKLAEATRNKFKQVPQPKSLRRRPNAIPRRHFSGG